MKTVENMAYRQNDVEIKLQILSIQVFVPVIIWYYQADYTV